MKLIIREDSYVDAYPFGYNHEVGQLDVQIPHL